MAELGRARQALKSLATLQAKGWEEAELRVKLMAESKGEGVTEVL